MSSHSLQNNLQEIRTSKNTRGYYSKGQFLTMTDIHRFLSSYKDVKVAGKTMMKNIDNVGSDDFLRVPLEFPVLALQHVTSHEHAKKILESQSFKGRQHERPEFKDLSFWSADISSDDIEKARLQAYETMRMTVKPEDMETFHEEIKEQFANSPAFNKSASCYGNFKFSFPLSFLLCRYKTQHCKDGEPQLRIFSTDIYKQEIVHYIVVHSPDTMEFDDLSKVSTMSTSSCDQVVCWMDETLYWRPQSTSNSLHLMISGGFCTCRIYEPNRKSPRPRRKMRPPVASCVWNHLVLAFHLPNDRKLNIPDWYLLRNLTPCHALQPFLRMDPIQKHQARQMIRKFRQPDSGRCLPQSGIQRTKNSPVEQIMRSNERLKKIKARQQKKAPSSAVRQQKKATGSRS